MPLRRSSKGATQRRNTVRSRTEEEKLQRLVIHRQSVKDELIKTGENIEDGLTLQDSEKLAVAFGNLKEQYEMLKEIDKELSVMWPVDELAEETQGAMQFATVINGWRIKAEKELEKRAQAKEYRRRKEIKFCEQSLELSNKKLFLADVTKDKVMQVADKRAITVAKEKRNEEQKELRDLNEKYKAESENNMKFKKINDELLLSIANKDKSIEELQDKLSSLQKKYSDQETDIRTLESQLEDAKNAWSQASDRSLKLEIRKHALLLELERMKERETTLEMENYELNNKCVEVQKNHARLVLERKNLEKKYEQERLAHRQDIDSLTADKKRLLSTTEGVNLESMKALQTKLLEEKNMRQKAEAIKEDKEREMLMLTVDFRQLELEFQKMKTEHKKDLEECKKDEGEAGKLITMKREKSRLREDRRRKASEGKSMRSRKSKRKKRRSDGGTIDWIRPRKVKLKVSGLEKQEFRLEKDGKVKIERKFIKWKEDVMTR